MDSGNFYLRNNRNKCVWVFFFNWYVLNDEALMGGGTIYMNQDNGP